MIKKSGSKILLVFSSSALATSIGLGAFVIINSQPVANISIEEVDAEPVCYINDPTNKYVSIESALNAAYEGDVVVVMPPDDYDKLPYINYTYPKGESVDFNDFATEKVEYHISEDCEIRQGVTLVLPYDQVNADETVTDVSTSVANMKRGIFEDNGKSVIETTKDDDSKVTSYNFLQQLSTSHKEIFLRTKVILDEGVSLTNNGNIIVSGMLSGGVGASSYNGQTSYYYSELCLSDNSKIINQNENANIYSFGYITEETKNNGSSIENQDGRIYLPFVLRDYRGVASSYAIYDNSMDTTYQMAPFNQMEFRNIEPALTNYYDGEIIGLANIHDSLQMDVDVSEEVNLIGKSNNFFIYLTNSKSYSILKYDNSTQVIDADFYGGFTLTKVEINITVSIASMTLSTENVFFPLSYRFDVSLNALENETAIYDCTNQDVKVMTGANLYIGENSTLNIDRLINYSAFADRKYPSGIGNVRAGGVTYDNTKKGGKVTVAGTIDANDLAGNIITYDTANLDYSNDAITAYEFVSFESDGMLYTTGIRMILKERLKETSYEDSINKTPLYIGVSTYDTLPNYSPKFNVITSDSTIGTYNSNDNYQTVLWVDKNTTYEVELLNDIYTVYRNGTTTQLARNTSFNTSTYNLMNVISSAVSISSNNNGINEFDIQSFNVTSLSYPIPIYEEETYIVFVGKTISLTAEFEDADKAYTKTPTWTSLDTSIATVNANGTVTGKKAGEVTIRATMDNRWKEFDLICYSGEASDIENFVPIESGTIVADKETLDDAGGNVTFTLSVFPANAWINTITWDSMNGSVVSTESGTRYGYHTYSITYTFPEKSGVNADEHKSIKATIVDYAGNSITVNAPTITVGCVIRGTKILTIDGYKNVEDLNQGDLLVVFNHYTGKMDVSPIVFNDYEREQCFQVVYLTFSNGDKIGVVSEHGFFSVTENKYVYIDGNNARSYLNDTFLARREDGKLEEVKLIDVEIVDQYIEIYSPVTFKHLNYFTEGILSMPGGIEGIFNIFELDQNHIVDKAKMEQDISKYGTFIYEDFANYISKDFYEAFNGKYLKVALGKGLLTSKRLEFLINRYSKFDN